MRTISFSADHPDAAVAFAILYQAIGTAQPGRRPLAQLEMERRIIAKLDAISTPAPMLPNGFTPRALREPCVLSITTTERDLIAAYLASASFQPFLSGVLLDLLAALAAAPADGADA